MERGIAYNNPASSSAPVEEVKNEEFKKIDVLPSQDPVSSSSVLGAISCNMARSIRRKPSKYRPLLEELGPEYYNQEDALMSTDRREVIIDTTIYPFSTHGRLIMFFDDKLLYGSGTLVRSNCVLTAAHNLYPRSLGREPDSILFIPALNGSDCPYGIIEIRRYFIASAIEYDDRKSEDYGLMELEEDVGESTGIIEIKPHSYEEIEGREYSIYGYPAYINQVQNYQLYGMSGPITINMESRSLRYYIDTSPGQSGSSIYYYSPECNKYFTVGVHARKNQRIGYNSGVPLTEERINQIKEWAESSIISTKHNLPILTFRVHGRYSELSRLNNYMSNRLEKRVVCLRGIAGVGKSTIALKFGHTSIGKYDYIWWIDSGTEETFISSVLSLCSALQIEGKSYQLKLKKLRYMINCVVDSILIILDNLQDESLAQEVIAAKGHYIITSRLEQTEFDSIEVSSLSREASLQLLSSRLRSIDNKDEEIDELGGLASCLENLPLALVQSATLIRNSRIEAREWIEKLSKLPVQAERFQNIVNYNLELLGEESKHILKIVCLGYHDNIQYDMLYEVFKNTYPDTSESGFNEYLGKIVRFNILIYDIKKELFKIHRPILQAATTILIPANNEELVRNYFNYLYTNYNPESDVDNGEKVDKIANLTHHCIQFLANFAGMIQSSKAILFYSRIAYVCIFFFINYETSYRYTKIIEQSLLDKFKEDKDLAKSYKKHVSQYDYSGDYKINVEYFLKYLRIQETIIPSNHPDLAKTYSILGSLYYSLGDYSRSEEYVLKCMGIRETIQPENHPDLAATYIHIESLYESLGDIKRSREYLLKCLPIRNLDEDYKEEAILGMVVPGKDGRELVEDVSALPHSAQVRVVVKFQEGEFRGSGTLVSPRHVLTAAHNLYSHRYRSEARSIVILFGLSGDQKPYREIKVKRYFYPYDYKSLNIEDYGLIELEEDIGASSGFIETKLLRAEEVDNLNISLYGYPTHMNKVRNFSLYGMSCSVRLRDRNLLIYELDISSGQSGSCIYYYSPEDGKYYAIGVHVRGYKNRNEGIFLNRERIDQIQKWMDYKVLTKHNLDELTSELYGRDSELFMIRSTMRSDKELSVVALSGVAGIGKTTIARKFATESIGSYDYIWWIDSTDEETFINSVLPLADILGTKDADEYETISQTIDYINSTNLSFLLIFDDLQDEQLAKDFIMDRGHFIITTQLGNIEFEKIEVMSLSSEASVQILSSKLCTGNFDEKELLANCFQRHTLKEMKSLVNFLKTNTPQELDLISNFCKKYPLEEIESFGSFLQGHPLALYQSGEFISKYNSKVSEFIKNFSKVIPKDQNINKIVTNSINSLSEESKYILKIACLGDLDNIPYETLYQVFRYSHTNTTKEEFDGYLGEITRLSIMSYDTAKDILKIYRFIQEVLIFKLSPSKDDSLIQNYSNYLYQYYNPLIETYTQEKVDHIKNLTQQAAEFLTKYKKDGLSTKDILNYSKLAISYYYFFNNKKEAIEYLNKVEASLINPIPEDSDLAQVIDNIEVLYYSMRDNTRCASYYSRSLEVRSRIMSETIPPPAATYNSLGALFYFMKDYARSKEYHSRCLVIRSLFPDQGDLVLAQSYESLGEVYYAMKEIKKSLEFYSICLKIRESKLPNYDPILAKTYYSLGELYKYMGNSAVSERYFLRCIAIRQRIQPPNYSELAQVYESLGDLYRSTGYHAGSLTNYLKLLEIKETRLQTDKHDLSMLYDIVGGLYLVLNRYEESERYYKKSLEIRQTIVNESQSNLASIYSGLAQLYSNTGQIEIGREYDIKYLMELECNKALDYHERADICLEIRKLYILNGEYVRGAEYYFKYLRIMEIIQPENIIELAKKYSELGDLFRSYGEYPNSEDCYLRCLRIREITLVKNHGDLIDIYNKLSDLYTSIGKHEEANNYRMKSQEASQLS